MQMHKCTGPQAVGERSLAPTFSGSPRWCRHATAASGANCGLPVFPSRRLDHSDKRFRGSIARPARLILPASHPGVAPMHAGFSTALPAGFGPVGLPASGGAGRPLGCNGESQIRNRAYPLASGFAWHRGGRLDRVAGMRPKPGASRGRSCRRRAQELVYQSLPDLQGAWPRRSRRSERIAGEKPRSEPRSGGVPVPGPVRSGL